MDLSIVRRKIAEGSLPRTDWDWSRLVVGAADRVCFVCQEPTSPVDMAVECHRAKIIFTLHPDCFVAWEEARQLER
jgi:hypothetical protein